MKIYLYDEKTKEYLSDGNAQLDPLETQKAETDVFIMPANATDKKPSLWVGYAPVWGGKAWKQVEDHRGQIYWLPSDKYGSAGHEMKDLGPLPEGATTTPPEQTPEEKKAEKIAKIDSQFKMDEATLIEYYTRFLMAGDTESAQEIVAELTALQEKYDKDIAEAEKEAEE